MDRALHESIDQGVGHAPALESVINPEPIDVAVGHLFFNHRTQHKSRKLAFHFRNQAIFRIRVVEARDLPLIPSAVKRGIQLILKKLFAQVKDRSEVIDRHVASNHRIGRGWLGGRRLRRG